MPSHPAVRLLGAALRGDRVEATLLLACGCTVTRTVPTDRVLAREDGSRFVAGKYPCPLGHPVRPPA